MYRDQDDAFAAKIDRLEAELEDTKRSLAEAREELVDLRRKYARARSVLAMIAHTRKVQNALEDAKSSPEELAEMMASPSNRPPPLSEAPPAAAPEEPARKRRSSAGRYILVNPDDIES